ncbi:hypothetical protein ACE6H2_015468 [Prunus campanulata]
MPQNYIGYVEGDDCEVFDIPRGKSNTCLPLPEDVKYVSLSASTTSELLDMNSGLNSLLFTKCMPTRTIIRELQQERHTKHNHDHHARKEIDDGEDENQIDDEDDEFGDNNNNGFETSCEDGENGADDDNEEENEEDEENEEED